MNATLKAAIAQNYEMVVPAVDDFIEALKMWSHSALTENGYENEAAAEEAILKGDPEAENFLNYFRLVKKQINLISDSIATVRAELESLDKQVEESSII